METTGEVDERKMEDTPVKALRATALPFLSWEFQGTPPKINIETGNDGLEDDFPVQESILRFHGNLPGVHTQVIGGADMN